MKLIRLIYILAKNYSYYEYKIDIKEVVDDFFGKLFE